jgi:hypothetical protein
VFVRFIGLLAMLAIIAGLVWYLLGGTGREATRDAVEQQVGEAKQIVKGIEETVGGEPMERLRKEDRDEMRRLLRERTSGN